MYNISRDELSKLKKIGCGNFGTAYLKGDKVLKVYHEYVKAYNESFCASEMVKNPDLRYNPIKYSYLKYISSKLDNTDLISDTLFINGIFKGIVMPYYDGETFTNHLYDDFDKKIAMSRQLLLNAKELTKNHIYPLDYKSNNIMLYDNKVQIIDLDDVKTKVLNPIYNKKSIETLDNAVRNFIGDIDYNLYINIDKNQIKKYLLKEENPINDTYQKIENYLANKIIKNNYILIDESVNTEIALLQNLKYRVVFAYKDRKYLIEKIRYLLSRGIKLYDIVPDSKIYDYLTSISYDELLTNKEKKLIKIN